MHETSSELLYDMNLIADFYTAYGILLIIDAVSVFLLDEVGMGDMNAAAVITRSQKALACHRGVSLIALAPTEIQRIEKNKEVCMYLSLKQTLKSQERGQTPFTSAVTTLLQIHERLIKISLLRGTAGEGEYRLCG